MAYDTTLEDRIDTLVASWDAPMSKKKMFGGLSYLINGNMCLGIYKDELIIRASEETGHQLTQIAGIRFFDMTGKPMKTWFMAESKAFKNNDQLRGLVETGRDFALTLPPK